MEQSITYYLLQVFRALVVYITQKLKLVGLVSFWLVLYTV